MTRTAWDVRIERAGVLADRYPASAEVLRFYQRVAETQGQLFRSFYCSQAELTGALVEAHFPALLDCVFQFGNQELATRAGTLRAAGSQAWEELVLGGFAAHGAAPQDFFARAFLQPYAEWYVEWRGAMRREEAHSASTCPMCGRNPQVAVLREEALGARRSLVCALCQHEWEYRRVLCPACGEQTFDALPVYTAAEFPHLRVEACDSCHTYLLSVDMTKDGHAVPCVDELAAIPLNLWAREQGYNRIEVNLFGL